jgi:hypothetical protein
MVISTPWAELLFGRRKWQYYPFDSEALFNTLIKLLSYRVLIQIKSLWLSVDNFSYTKRKFTVKYYAFGSCVWKLEPLPNPYSRNRRLKHLVITQPNSRNSLCLLTVFKRVKFVHKKRIGLQQSVAKPEYQCCMYCTFGQPWAVA